MVAGVCYVCGSAWCNRTHSEEEREKADQRYLETKKIMEQEEKQDKKVADAIAQSEGHDGVSQWRNYGKKMGYWAYFADVEGDLLLALQAKEQELRERVFCKCGREKQWTLRMGYVCIIAAKILYGPEPIKGEKKEIKKNHDLGRRDNSEPSPEDLAIFEFIGGIMKPEGAKE